LLPQTRRHSLLAQLLRVPNIVFAVNKIDAVQMPRAAFEAVRDALLAFAREAGMPVAAVLPLSALRGDNVIQPIDEPWYRGPSLLQLLESLPAAQERTEGALLMPVQYVTRGDDTAADGTGHQSRTLWGRIAHGRVRAGDALQVFPSGERAVVQALRRAGGAVEAAEAGQSVGLVLDRQLDVSRGDWIGTPDTLLPAQRFGATLAWLDTEAAVIGRKYVVRHGNRWVNARIVSIGHRLDIRTLRPTDAHELSVNDIGRVGIELQQPLPLEPYAQNRVAGSLILVDPASNRTSGALLVNAVR
jgi:sulfate adenylyltransferase subunit 1